MIRPMFALMGNLAFFLFSENFSRTVKKKSKHEKQALDQLWTFQKANRGPILTLQHEI